MRDFIKYMFFATVGAIVGTDIYLITKKKQKKAKEERTHVPYGPYEAVIKRPLDMVLSGIALIMLAPLMIFITVATAIKMKGNPFFTQQRPGKNEKIFLLIKFRSMTNERDKDGNLLPDDVRLTNYGKFLRSTSLDELPELLNIIKGDMSFVGPRPLAIQYLPYYRKKEKKRHAVLPGLTGLAQIHGRNATTWEERLTYDVKYAEHISFTEDLRILFETIIVVLKHSGIGIRGVNSLDDFDEYRRKQTLNIKEQ